jgi:hypothetical protein
MQMQMRMQLQSQLQNSHFINSTESGKQKKEKRKTVSKKVRIQAEPEVDFSLAFEGNSLSERDQLLLAIESGLGDYSFDSLTNSHGAVLGGLSGQKPQDLQFVQPQEVSYSPTAKRQKASDERSVDIESIDTGGDTIDSDNDDEDDENVCTLGSLSSTSVSKERRRSVFCSALL